MHRPGTRSASRSDIGVRRELTALDAPFHEVVERAQHRARDVTPICVPEFGIGEDLGRQRVSQLEVGRVRPHREQEQGPEVAPHVPGLGQWTPGDVGASPERLDHELPRSWSSGGRRWSG